MFDKIFRNIIMTENKVAITFESRFDDITIIGVGGEFERGRIDK